MAEETIPFLTKEIQDDSYDVALIFANPFQDEDLGLKSGFEGDMSKKSAVKKFKRIFLIDEKSEEQEFPYDKLRESLKQLDSEESPRIDRQEFVKLVMDNVLLVIQHHCMLESYPFYSRDRDEIFLKIRASEDNLKVQADLDDYILQFKQEEGEVEPFQQVSPYAPYELRPPKQFVFLGRKPDDFYRKYDKDGQETEDGSYFQYKDKARLIYTTLHTNLDIGLLRSQGILLRYMPLHSKEKLEALRTTWGRYVAPYKAQNLTPVRVYYGEKITMYFAWLEYLMHWMFIPGCIGLILGILELAFGNTDDEDSAMSGGEGICFIVAVALPIFGVFFEQTWIRKEKTLAWKWGTYDLFKLEDQRPEFIGTYEVDKISGRIKKIRKLSEWHKFKKFVSFVVSFTFVLAVLIVIILLFLYKASLSSDSWGPTMIGILNAIQIKVFNMIYTYVARWLNDKENHEYPSQYNDSFTTKLFLFQFINSYTSLFYIAFAKGYFEGCEDDNCLGELQLQLATIFITNFCLNALEILTPIAMAKFKRWMEDRKLKKLEQAGEEVRHEMSSVEAQSKMSVYDTPMSDYMELVISFGYILLFAASFPLAITIFMILIYIERTVDAFKLCNLTQRPFPDYASTIGVWLNIVKLMVIASAMTNVGIIIFTSNIFEIEEDNGRWLLFLILEHVLLALKFIIAGLIPNKPKVVKNGLEWSERIVNERLYGRLTDLDKARKGRDLTFTEPQPRKVYEPDYRTFSMYDGES